jgi:hypothetical protein
MFLLVLGNYKFNREWFAVFADDWAHKADVDFAESVAALKDAAKRKLWVRYSSSVPLFELHG